MFNMKRFLSILSIGVVVAAGTLTAVAQFTREGSAEKGMPSREAPRGVKVAPGLLKGHETRMSSSGPFREISAKMGVPVRKHTTSERPKIKAAPKASSLQGYCVYGQTYGWYDVDFSWPTLKWQQQTSVNPRAGFVRGDEIYAFYSYATSDAGIMDAGLYVLDRASGAVKATYPTDIFDTLEEVVVLAAYDELEDIAYVGTYDKTGKSHILQTFDPKTRKFTNLGVNLPTDWLDLGWNPADKALYLFDETGLLKKYDSKGKKFAQVNSLSWDMEAYPHDMVYSPNDEGFIIAVDSYDEDDYPCTDFLLLPVAGRYSYLGTISSNPQYSILYVSDSYVNSEGAAAPELKSWNVEGPATTGSFTITLPTKYENGKAISGNIYLEVKMDDAVVAGSYNGAPGSDVTIPVNGEEGLHRFYVTPYTLGDDGRILGTPLVFEKCLGADTPSAPANVKLTETNVSWDAVATGVNGGYVVPGDIKYNVYVDKVLMTPSPISATTLDITIPKTGAVAHRAEVYAIAGDKTSEAGVSGKFYAEGALDLPVYLGVDEGEKDLDDEVIDMFTIVKDALNKDELRGWRYDDQSEQTGGFYCLYPLQSSTGEIANEWLFLPAINFTDAKAHYRLAMDVWTGGHYFSGDEVYEVALCKAPSARGATIIKEATTVHKTPYFEQSEALFQVPEAGEWYIGIHYISPLGNYRLYARNFSVAKAEASADSPAAVTELRSKAAADGVLEATLTFKMPAVSISGSELPASTVITAVATCEGGEASVTGAPGEEVSLKVPTVQGDNIITVTTSSDKGEGMLAETVVYCGVYRPTTPVLTSKVADDNMSITLNVEIPTYNENGEWTGPEDQEVTVYRDVNGEWRPAAEIGKNRSWTFTVTDPTQEAYSFAVASKNAVGYCEDITNVVVHLGTLYNLPLVENFPTTGDVVNFKEPVTIEHISYLRSTWGFTDPVDMDENAANASGNAIAAMWDGESQLLLPRFTTKGMNNVKFDLSLFFGNLSPELVTVFASSSSMEMQELAQFTPQSGSGWEHKLISLPEGCQNQGWVQLVVRVKIVGYNQCFLMDSYSVADYPADMVTIVGLNGASRGAVGEPLAYNVEIENAGTSETSFPEYTFRVLGDNGVIADLQAENAPARMGAGEKVTLKFGFTPKADDKGNAVVKFNIAGQPEAAVSEVEKQLTILNARVPVVDDLALSYGEGGNINLSWSEPKFTEDFEVAEPWDYSENIRGFRNIDLDGSKVWTITEADFPGEGFEKAYQVFSTTSTNNGALASHSGEHYLLCMSPKSGETNDWLISPEVKGGSKFSFWMNICHADYPEVVLVKYSTTGNNPEDFKQTLADGYICPDNQGWTKYEFELPADAKYFALHHVGDDGYEQFGFMIDDVAYEAANGAYAIEGYNLYRDDALVASGVKDASFVDKGVDVSVPVRYYVKTLSKINEELVESDRSNVIWATDGSGVSEMGGGVATISGVKGAVKLNGFAAGTAYSVNDAAGIALAAGEVADDCETIALPAGIYIVRCGSATVKVVVK